MRAVHCRPDPPSPDGPRHPLPEAALPPRTRRPPRPRSAPLPTAVRRGKKRRGLRKAGGRRLAALFLGALLLLALPPLRAIVGNGWSTVRGAVAETRREDARRAHVAGYARHYGISFELAEAIHAAAEAEGLAPELAFRLVRVESEFREDAVSPVGALGLTQLMPATAADLQPGITPEEILERDTNLRLGFRYMRLLLRLYDGDVREALLAYNRGMGTVDRIRAAGGDPGNGYARKVLGERGRSPVHHVPPADSVPLKASPLHEMAPARLPPGL